METKNIFKSLAMAMLLPAMLLTTACSNDDFTVNDDNNVTTAKQGYTLPVTVNVTREGDATMRATYTESTGKLSFSAGDQLFILGTRLVMIVETPLDFDWDSAMARLATLPRQQEWEDYMAMFQQCKEGATSDEKWQMMEQMFYLYE